MIFISYSVKDSNKAKELRQLCESFQIPTFMAELSLLVGETWKDRIVNELNESQVVIVLLSKHSLESVAVQHEIGAAIFSRKLIIPIALGIEFSDIPSWLSHIQAIKYEDFRESELEQVIRRTKATSGFFWTVGLIGILLLFMKRSNSLKRTDLDRRKGFLRQKIVELHAIASELNREFSDKKFTIDGRLVGDIGEAIAEIDYDIVTFEKLKKAFDALSRDGKRVQIKVTFKSHIGFKCVDEHFLALKFEEDGRYREIYNGPARYILERYSTRRGIGTILQPLPIEEIEKLGRSVPQDERVPRRLN